ncbi:unnamed protein product [Euphydryas editha]|uniref:Ommochrome-binding protein n=1 Tax=Euphydryas editha TaxID=104508 RepID=A0AAU9UGX9_EUPED|nr:unnamed protein product [Euphydryas editha]
MKLLIILTLATLTYADKRCQGVFVHDSYYSLSIIKDGINNLHDMAINRRDSSVYFTFDDLSEIPSKLLAHLDMNTHKATLINGIRNATAIAIDQVNSRVYVGGSDGLFKINEITKVPERLPIQDDIKSMHYKGALYFINTKREAYKFEDGHATLVPELQGVEVDSLVLDDDNNIFFTQNTKLFRIKLNTRAINTHENYLTNFLTVDKYKKVYICTNKGLYMYNKFKYVFDKVADFNNLKAITFNSVNEPIYAVADYIIKLNLNEVPCFED